MFVLIHTVERNSYVESFETFQAAKDAMVTNFLSNLNKEQILEICSELNLKEKELLFRTLRKVNLSYDPENNNSVEFDYCGIYEESAWFNSGSNEDWLIIDMDSIPIQYFALYDLNLNGFKAGYVGNTKSAVEKAGAERAWELSQNDEEPCSHDLSDEEILKEYNYEVRLVNKDEFDIISESEEFGLLTTVDLSALEKKLDSTFAYDYIQENFSLDVVALSLIENILSLVEGMSSSDGIQCLTELLDARIGISENEIIFLDKNL